MRNGGDRSRFGAERARRDSRVSRLLDARLRGQSIDLASEIKSYKDELEQGLLPRSRWLGGSPPTSRTDSPAVLDVGDAVGSNTEVNGTPATPPYIRPATPASGDVGRKPAKVEGGASRGSHRRDSERLDRPEVRAEDAAIASPELVGAHLLRKVLTELRIGVLEVDPAKVVLAPGFTRYRVLFRPAVRLSQVRARAEDIARGMASTATPLINNSPGEEYIAIDFPRLATEIISLWPIIADWPVPPPGTIPILLGISPSGERLTLDLAEAPHAAVGGGSGSGKSVLLHGVVTSLTCQRTPEELELLLVDPKGTDLGAYERLPHLHGRGVLSAPAETAEALRRVVEEEFEARTTVLKLREVASVADLNRSEGRIVVRPLVIIIEEFSELLESFDDRHEARELHRDVLRIAQRARSLGIHLILVTQRPSVDVVAGKLKTNLPVRICFRVTQAADSRVILDRGGAELLNGRGDFLLLHNNQITRGHSCFASSQEVSRFVAERAGEAGACGELDCAVDGSDLQT